MAGASVSVVSRSSDQGDAEQQEEAEGVGEPPADPGLVQHDGERLVEIEGDHAGEEDVEEHQRRAPEALARQRVGQPQR